MFHGRNSLTRTKDYISRIWSFLDYYLVTPAGPTHMCQVFLAIYQQSVSNKPTDQLTTRKDNSQADGYK